MTARRSAYTLIEALVVLVLIGTVLGTIGLNLHALQRAYRKMQEKGEIAHSLARFTRQWRADVHAARSVELVDDPSSPHQRLRLVYSAGQSIEYFLEPDTIRRVVIKDEQAVHRDEYHLPLASTAAWQVESQRQPPLVVLADDRPLKDASDWPITRIEAAGLEFDADLLASPAASPASPSGDAAPSDDRPAPKRQEENHGGE